MTAKAKKGLSVGRFTPLWMALLCGTLTPLTAASESFWPSAKLCGLIAGFWWIVACIVLCTVIKQARALPGAMILSAGIILLFWGLFHYIADQRAFLLGIAGLMTLCIIAMGLLLQNRLSERQIALLLLCAGILLRVVYVLYTSATTRQHDVWSFGESEGHAGYIEYLYNNGKLPDFDVRTVDQFYHPPLHHILCALWMRLLTSLGMAYDRACECVQILPLFYSMLILWISYRIFEAFSLSGGKLLVPLAIVSFHPTFFLLAGSINNDTLSITFALAAVLYAIRWYRNQTVWRILQVALCIGLGMSTKLSVYMVAPAIGLLFLMVLFRNRQRIGQLLGQYAAFGVVCVPLGLWWSIRNFLLYGVPPTYVPMLSEKSKQYVGNIPILERLFSFGNGQLSSVYEQFEFYGGKYFEYNPTLGILKTSLFGELINDWTYPSIRIWGVILFWSAAALAVWAIVSLILALCRRIPKDAPLRWMFGVLFVTYLALFYVFCITYPHTCTMDVRYIAPLIPLGALFIGLNMPESKWFQWIYGGVTTVFCVASAAVYLLIAL